MDVVKLGERLVEEVNGVIHHHVRKGQKLRPIAKIEIKKDIKIKGVLALTSETRNVVRELPEMRHEHAAIKAKRKFLKELIAR